MSDLKTQLIKLGSTNPELRPHIREILASDRYNPNTDFGGYLEKTLKQMQSTHIGNARLAFLWAFSNALATELNKAVNKAAYDYDPSHQFKVDDMGHSVASKLNYMNIELVRKGTDFSYEVHVDGDNGVTTKVRVTSAQDTAVRAAKDLWEPLEKLLMRWY